MACFGFFSLYDVQLCFNCIISSHMVDPIEIVYVCLYYYIGRLFGCSQLYMVKYENCYQRVRVWSSSNNFILYINIALPLSTSLSFSLSCVFIYSQWILHLTLN